jgi:hypothetical protein
MRAAASTICLLALSFAAGRAGATGWGDARRWRESRPVGAPVACIPATNILERRVYEDGRTIDFRMATGEIIRNRLPAPCPDLAVFEAFATQSRGGRLCSVDAIRVITPSGLNPRACALGPFQEVEQVDAPRRR